MAWHYLYDSNTKRLISEYSKEITPGPGQAVKSFNNRPSQERMLWNVDKADFIAGPKRKRYIDKSDFLELFTEPELELIIATSKNNLKIELLLVKLNLVSRVNLDSRKLKTGLKMMETNGILGSGRSEEILNG